MVHQRVAGFLRGFLRGSGNRPGLASRNASCCSISRGRTMKLENLKAAVALYFAHYNFCRIHGTLRVTPAMEAGLTDHIWTIGELLFIA